MRPYRQIPKFSNNFHEFDVIVDVVFDPTRKRYIKHVTSAYAAEAVKRENAVRVTQQSINLAIREVEMRIAEELRLADEKYYAQETTSTDGHFRR